MTSFTMKIIAIIAMTLDHFVFTIGQAGLINIFNMSMHSSAQIIEIMGDVGRLAFPLFAFMIAEGSRKTHNIKKYAGRLAIFAIISEPFFYFAHNYKASVTFKDFLLNLAELRLENVFFTLAISVFAIYICQIIKSKSPEKWKYWFIPIMLAFGLIASFFNMDYSIYGVILIMALYVCRSRKASIIVIILWSIIVYGIGGLIGSELCWPQIQSVLCRTVGAALSCLPIWFYNGKRGRNTKWLFYIYYPAHLFILAVIGSMLLA